MSHVSECPIDQVLFSLSAVISEMDRGMSLFPLRPRLHAGETGEKRLAFAFVRGNGRLFYLRRVPRVYVNKIKMNETFASAVSFHSVLHDHVTS